MGNNTENHSNKKFTPSRSKQKNSNNRNNPGKKNSFPQNNNEFIPQEKREVFAYCKICNTGISNEAYSLKLGEDHIHFECAIKKVREIAVGENNSLQAKRYKVSYVGSNTFSVYIEKGDPFQWEIIKKVTLQELLLSLLPKE